MAGMIYWNKQKKCHSTKSSLYTQYHIVFYNHTCEAS